jgi:hypothetical protein
MYLELISDAVALTNSGSSNLTAMGLSICLRCTKVSTQTDSPTQRAKCRVGNFLKAYQTFLTFCTPNKTFVSHRSCFRGYVRYNGSPNPRAERERAPGTLEAGVVTSAAIEFECNQLVDISYARGAMEANCKKVSAQRLQTQRLKSAR